MRPVKSTPGNHGNLNAQNVVTGRTIIVPPSIGEYQTTITPLGIDQAVVGCLILMLEEDNTPNSAIATGHDRLNRLFQLELSKLVQTKLSQGLNSTLTEAEINSLKQSLSTAVLQTIKDNVSVWDFLGGFGDMDDIIGSKVFTFTTKQIKDSGNILHFSQQWTPRSGSEDGDYEIRGVVTLNSIIGEDTQGLINKDMAPSAERYAHDGVERTYVFHPGTNGNLYVNFWSGAIWQWSNQGHPSETLTHGYASALVYVINSQGYRLSAFIAGQNGNLYENLWNGASWQWVNHGQPPGTIVSDHPSAIKYTRESSGRLSEIYQRIHVFIVGANGELFSRNWNYTTWQWVLHGKHSVNLVGCPAVATMYIQGKQRVYSFVRGLNGNLYERYWDGSNWHWTEHGAPTGTTIASDPDAVYIRLGGVERLYVFMIGSDGNLYARFWNGTKWDWGNLNHPQPGITGRPSSVAYQFNNQSRINVFVLGKNGELQETFWDGSRWQWSIRGRMSNILLTSPPDAISWPQGGIRQIHIAEVGEKNQTYAHIYNGQWQWFHQGTP